MTAFDRKKYKKMVEARAKRSPVFKNMLFAFLIGGGVCLLGEGLACLYARLGLSAREAGMTVTVTLISLSALLTLFGVFDRIARVAGAGTLLPVTGFANAVVSPAMDNKSEGFVMGVGAKMFIVAGPVLVFGTASGAILGVILYLFG